MRILSVKCPNCGLEMRIPERLALFKCPDCDKVLGNTDSLTEVIDELISSGIDVQPSAGGFLITAPIPKDEDEDE